MKAKFATTAIVMLLVTLGVSSLPAQSKAPVSPVQELPNFEDISWCRDLPKDTGEEYCKGGPEGFQGHWFEGADK